MARCDSLKNILNAVSVFNKGNYYTSTDGIHVNILTILV